MNMMSTSSLRVGGDTLSFCTKCKLTLGHTIIAMLNERTVAKVKCNTCQGVHKYKDPASPSTAGRSSANAIRALTQGKDKKKSADNTKNVWESQVKCFSGSPKNYSTREKFKVGDIIAHSQFGNGLVESLLEADKIFVIFQFGQKMLLHNKK